MEIKIQAEIICEFSTYQQWVNKADSWLTGFNTDQKIICVDVRGNSCTIGKDFMLARDNNLFPVKAYRLIRTVETFK